MYLCWWHLAIHTVTYTLCNVIAVYTREAGVQKTERSGFGLSFPCSLWGYTSWYQLGRRCFYFSLSCFRGTLSSSIWCWLYIRGTVVLGVPGVMKPWASVQLRSWKEGENPSFHLLSQVVSEGICTIFTVCFCFSPPLLTMHLSIFCGPCHWDSSIWTLKQMTQRHGCLE